MIGKNRAWQAAAIAAAAALTPFAAARAAGLSWHLNEHPKWMLDYARTTYDGGAAAGADRDDTDALVLRNTPGF